MPADRSNNRVGESLRIFRQGGLMMASPLDPRQSAAPVLCGLGAFAFNSVRVVRVVRG